MKLEDEKHKVPIDFIVPDVVESCYMEVRKKFELLIAGTDSLTDVQVLAGLSLRIVRLSIATRSLIKAGLFEESQLPFRSAAECTVNLLYILKVGPALGDKTSNALAKQFSAYGDVAYEKMLKARPATARRAFKRAQGMTDAEYDIFYADKLRLSTDAKTVHGCRSSRWHTLSLTAMAEKVRDNRPPFVDGQFADLMFSSFQGQNSAVHADALSLRSQYKALGNAPLEIKLVSDSMYADATAMMTLWSWKMIADYYGQLDWLQDMLEKAMRHELGKRLDAEIERSKRVILLPWELT